ncbi:MAG: hypothetical protein LC808_12480 [Actinobacteria bacterium]|nr:hypothetical protein [Actinomycetota bacterium]
MLSSRLRGCDLCLVAPRWPVGVRVVVQDSFFGEVIGLVQAGMQDTHGDAAVVQ